MEDRFKFRAFTPIRPSEDSEYEMKTLSILSVENLATLDHPVMQSTGLKDKNGTLVFECDIVQWPWRPTASSEEIIKTEVVNFNEYADNEGWADDKHLGWNTTFGTLPDVIASGGLVIGNIHENPELIK